MNSSSSSPRVSQFSICLASISNDENMRFRPAIFIRLILAPFCTKWHKKILLFMVEQKLRSYTQQLMHNDMPKLDYLYLIHPASRCIGIRVEQEVQIVRNNLKTIRRGTRKESKHSLHLIVIPCYHFLIFMTLLLQK